MKKIHVILWLAVIALVSGCGSTVRIYSDTDQTGQFEKYTTYSFLDFTDGNKKTIPGMELERIRVAVARELEKRGLEFVEAGGDVSVRVTVYHREAMDHYYWYPSRYVYMERAIAVDMFDNATKKHVWHCAAVDELKYDPEERARQLPAVAAKIFEEYPVPPMASL